MHSRPVSAGPRQLLILKDLRPLGSAIGHSHATIASIRFIDTLKMRWTVFGHLTLDGSFSRELIVPNQSTSRKPIRNSRSLIQDKDRTVWSSSRTTGFEVCCRRLLKVQAYSMDNRCQVAGALMICDTLA